MNTTHLNTKWSCVYRFQTEPRGSQAVYWKASRVLPVTLTCLLASTISGRLGSEVSSACRCSLATGKCCGWEESTTNTSSRALDMYFCQYGRSSSLPPTDRHTTDHHNHHRARFTSCDGTWTCSTCGLTHSLRTRCAGPLCWWTRRWSPGSAACRAPGCRWTGSAADWFYRLHPDPEPEPGSPSAWTVDGHTHTK